MTVIESINYEKKLKKNERKVNRKGKYKSKKRGEIKVQIEKGNKSPKNGISGCDVKEGQFLRCKMIVSTKIHSF